MYTRQIEWSEISVERQINQVFINTEEHCVRDILRSLLIANPIELVCRWSSVILLKDLLGIISTKLGYGEQLISTGESSNF